MYFYRYRGLGVAPVVGYGVKIGATAAAKRIFGGFGPSAAFESRQAQSDKFFATRNAVFKIESQMSPEQYAEWKLLSLHKADYNLRRENAQERSELYAFVGKLQKPEAWAVPGVPGVVTPGVVTAAAIPGVGLLKSPVILIAIAGLVALVFLKK